MKILIFAYTGLGNFILKTPLIRAIHREILGAEVHLLCGNNWGAEKVLEHGSWIKKVHWLPEASTWNRKFEVFSDLRVQRFDMVIMPFDSSPLFAQLLSLLYFRDAICVAHSSINRFSKSSILLQTFKLVLFKFPTLVPLIRNRHEIDLNLDLLLITLLDTKWVIHYTKIMSVRLI